MNLTEKTARLLPTDADKIQMILTLLGCAGHLGEYFMKLDLKKIPHETIYILQMVAGNMIAFSQDIDEKNVEKIDWSHTNMYEQTQQTIFERIKLINENISQYIKECEKV